MTIRIRNTIFISALSAAGIILLLFLLGSMFTLYSLGETADSLIDSESTMINISHVFVLLIFSLVSGIILLYSFRKTSSPEVFFYIIFLLLFSLEGLRLALIYIKETGMPLSLGRTLSRGIYFSRFLGTICLFLSGLFSCGIRNQRIEILLVSGILIAMVLAATIPLDNRGTGFNLVYTNGLEDLFFTGFLILKILGIWNYFYAGIINNNRNYFLIGLGILMTTAGRELVLGFSASGVYNPRPAPFNPGNRFIRFEDS